MNPFPPLGKRPFGEVNPLSQGDDGGEAKTLRGASYNLQELYKFVKPIFDQLREKKLSLRKV